jgi:hypothetical protein
MSMTYEDARAILKRRFDGGTLPRALQSRFAILASTPRYEDDGGEDVQQAVQSGTPQAASADFETAAGNFQGGTYGKWLVPLVEHYSLFRVMGRAMEAAKKKGDKAFIDLLKSETDGAAITEMKCEEIYLTRNGTGIKGQVSTSATISSATFPLQLTDDIINFDLYEKVEAYDADTLTSTKYVGSARIVGIVLNPDVGQMTLDGALNAKFNVTSAASVYLCRAGDGHDISGNAVVITGDDEWVKGGTSPGTLFGLNRDTNAVAYAGQTYDGSSKGYEEAIIDMEALLGYAWGEDDEGAGRACKINTRDLAQLKKVAASRMTLDRMKSAVGGLSFNVIKFAGDYGDIKFLASPFVRRGRTVLGPTSETILESMGPVPRMFHWNNEKVLTVSNADAAEGRCGMYGRYRVRNPMAFVRCTNFGGAA